MLIGYVRVCKTDDSQALDLQRDALLSAGVDPSRVYQDTSSGKRDERPGLDACLKGLCSGDTLIAWKLDRLGRDLPHLINLARDLAERGMGLRILAGKGAAINTSTPNGQLAFGVFGALAEFERDLVVERTGIGLGIARARGLQGGRPYKMTRAKLRLAQAAIGRRETRISTLCAELGITCQTLYRYVDPEGRLRPDGEKLLSTLQAGMEQDPQAGRAGTKAGDQHV